MMVLIVLPIYLQVESERLKCGRVRSPVCGIIFGCWGGRRGRAKGDVVD
jgi:hypothetical protein